MSDQQEPKAPSEEPLQKPPAKVPIITSIGRIFAAPFVAVGRLVRGSKKIDEIVVFSAPPAFYLWIVIATGFVLRLLVPTHVLTEQAGAWIFIFVLIYFILAILYDMSLLKL